MKTIFALSEPKAEDQHMTNRRMTAHPEPFHPVAFEFVHVGWRGTSDDRQGHIFTDNTAAPHKGDEPVYVLRLTSG